MYYRRSSYHEASLVPGVVAARRDEGIPDMEVQRGLIRLDREAIEMTTDAAREVLGAHPLHALSDLVYIDLRMIEQGRQAEPVGDPKHVTPALCRGRLLPGRAGPDARGKASRPAPIAARARRAGDHHRRRRRQHEEAHGRLLLRSCPLHGSLLSAGDLRVPVRPPQGTCATGDERAQRRRQSAAQGKYASAARRDVGAVLHVAIRPEALCRCVVALVEQRVERFEDRRLGLLGRGLPQVISLPAVFVLPSAAEPTMFQLSCTTTDGSNVAADRFLA